MEAHRSSQHTPRARSSELFQKSFREGKKEGLLWFSSPSRLLGCIVTLPLCGAYLA